MWEEKKEVLVKREPNQKRWRAMAASICRGRRTWEGEEEEGEEEQEGQEEEKTQATPSPDGRKTTLEGMRPCGLSLDIHREALGQVLVSSDIDDAVLEILAESQR